MVYWAAYLLVCDGDGDILHPFYLSYTVYRYRTP
jgi:hypothetical protein